IGVAMANGILLVTFAEAQRREVSDIRAATVRERSQELGVSAAAAVEAASRRLRPILMTSAAMIAGMLPMAFALGEAGRQTAPVARAVLGGLALATLATLFVLPCIFAIVQRCAKITSASLAPDDPASTFFDQPPAAAPAAS